MLKWLKKFDKEDEAQWLLKKTGYKVTLDDQDKEVLVHSETGERVKKNEKKYDKICKYLLYYVQMRLERQFGLEERYIPFKNDVTDKCYSQAPIYVSPDWKSNEKKALILIQGTGEVRAGVWARSVCINDSLDLGSMLPQVKFAVENKMSCLIMNPNFKADPDGVEVDPRVNTMEKHCRYVFKKYVIRKCKANEIFIIAHSRGGH